jgi:hypothetical protein
LNWKVKASTGVGARRPTVAATNARAPTWERSGDCRRATADDGRRTIPSGRQRGEEVREEGPRRLWTCPMKSGGGRSESEAASEGARGARGRGGGLLSFVLASLGGRSRKRGDEGAVGRQRNRRGVGSRARSEAEGETGKSGCCQGEGTTQAGGVEWAGRPRRAGRPGRVTGGGRASRGQVDPRSSQPGSSQWPAQQDRLARRRSQGAGRWLK